MWYLWLHVSFASLVFWTCVQTHVRNSGIVVWASCGFYRSVYRWWPLHYRHVPPLRVGGGGGHQLTISNLLIRPGLVSARIWQGLPSDSGLQLTERMNLHLVQDPENAHDSITEKNGNVKKGGNVHFKPNVIRLVSDGSCFAPCQHVARQRHWRWWTPATKWGLRLTAKAKCTRVFAHSLEGSMIGRRGLCGR